MKVLLIFSVVLVMITLSACLPYEYNPRGAFCEEKGYSNWAYINNGEKNLDWICFTIKNNEVVSVSKNIYSYEKQPDCKVYNKGDGCAE